jgi:hypothetical protein
MPSARGTGRYSLLLSVAILAIGAAVRLLYLDVPPLDFHATRQYRSALIARGESRVAMATFDDRQREAAYVMRGMQGAIEPEVIETIVARLYDLAGREDLRLPRLLSILAWLGAACAAGWMVRLGGLGWPMAWLAMAVTLLAPYGVDASRAFMPDPLMTGLMMAALGCALRHDRTPGFVGFVVRAAVAAAAVFIKPMAAFIIAPAFLALDIGRLGVMRGLLSSALSVVLVAAPAAWHYLQLIAEGNAVAQNRFFPQLLSRASFWSGWGVMLGRVIGLPAFVIAVSAMLLATGSLRRVLVASWLGYVALGLTFTRHISTHDYYSLPMLPIAAVSIAAALAGLHRRLPHGARHAATAVVAAAVLIAWIPRASLAGVYGDVEGARQTAADYRRIGELASHSIRVVSLDGSYGYPLAYHALVATSQMPLSFDRAVNELQGQQSAAVLADFESRNGEYFVVTMPTELAVLPELQERLDTRHVLVARGGDEASWRWVMYDLTRVRVSASPPKLSVFMRAGGGESAGDVRILAPAGAPWRAVSSDPARVRIEPATGTGDTTVRIIGVPGAAGAHADIPVALFSGDGPEAAGSFTVVWHTREAAANIPPFGSVDAPPDPITPGDGPIVFQGWALDDVHLVRVDAVARDASGRETILGQVTRAGRRQDVAAVHPTAHDLERAAWSFVLTRAQLDSVGAGAGSIAILFRAVDADGTTGVIGQRTVRR